MQSRARDPGRELAGEKHRAAGAVAGKAEAAHRYPAWDMVAVLRGDHLRNRHLCAFGRFGRDDVHADVLRREFERDAFGKAGDRRLERGIDGSGRRAAIRFDCRHVDDAASALAGPDEGQGSACAGEDVLQIDGIERVPVFLASRFERAAQAKAVADIVDENVQHPCFALDLREGAFDILNPADVAFEDMVARSQSVTKGLCPFRGYLDGEDPRAKGGEGRRDRQADTRARPGHHRDLAIEADGRFGLLRHAMTIPPSTGIATPVTKLAPGETRKIAAAAISTLGTCTPPKRAVAQLRIYSS